MYAKFLPFLFGGFVSSVSAAESPKLDLDLEPCINGSVSASGTFPSQAMEEQVNAYLDWSDKNGAPYYIFRVAGYRLTSAYPQR